MINSFIFLVLLPWTAFAGGLWDTPDWSEDVLVASPRENIYELSESEFKSFDREGRLHALWYPVTVTGLKVPYRPIDEVFKPNDNPFKQFLLNLADITIKMGSVDDLYQYMGLKNYPEAEGEGAYFVPFKNGVRPLSRMGISFGESDGATYVTASCTACHAESLFGRPVIGLPNKTPRANETFYRAHQIAPKVNPELFQMATKATDAETLMWQKARETLNWIGVKEPQVLGLDTSLATVSLSLSKRDLDPYATVSEHAYKKPRKDILETFIADSKPLPWFVVKYKNRWLSDGSVVSGNPVLTNILWNEVGRGVDLKVLEEWAKTPHAQKQIIELTSAVFATTPPKYTDFFGKSAIHIESARRGEGLFNQTCFKCHGTYTKDWDKTTDTIEVHYPEKTLVKDVGTDPNRWMGMKDLSENLNRLAFSDTFNIKTIPQKGYVPPPLVGIWARWPYFHNNSAPTLCDVLKKQEKRRKYWFVGEPVDPEKDFDHVCNGFPEKVRESWKTRERLFDTTRKGLNNSGHFFKEYSESEVADLVMYLKTL